MKNQSKPYINYMIIIFHIFILILLYMSSVFGADGSAVEIDMVNNLSATVKNLLTGRGALIIDGIIFSSFAMGAAYTRTPSLLFAGLLSTALWHLGIHLIV